MSGSDDRRLAFGQPQVAAHVRRRIGVRTRSDSGPSSRSQLTRAGHHQPTGRPVGASFDDGRALRDDHEAHRRFGPEQPMDGGDRGRGDLVVAGGRDELEPGAA